MKRYALLLPLLALSGCFFKPKHLGCGEIIRAKPKDCAFGSKCADIAVRMEAGNIITLMASQALEPGDRVCVAKTFEGVKYITEAK